MAKDERSEYAKRDWEYNAFVINDSTTYFICAFLLQEKLTFVLFFKLFYSFYPNIVLMQIKNSKRLIKGVWNWGRGSLCFDALKLMYLLRKWLIRSTAQLSAKQGFKVKHLRIMNSKKREQNKVITATQHYPWLWPKCQKIAIDDDDDCCCFFLLHYYSYYCLNSSSSTYTYLHG